MVARMRVWPTQLRVGCLEAGRKIEPAATERRERREWEIAGRARA